jgi:hypothetical protein
LFVAEEILARRVARAFRSREHYPISVSTWSMRVQKSTNFRPTIVIST